MSCTKSDVIWSPLHIDKFILWNSDITLYEVSPLKDIDKKSCIKLSPSSGASVIASQSAAGVRCIDACALPELQEPLVALGHTSGRITLTSLGQNLDTLGLSGIEFAARHPRVCTSVAWSHTETSMLAAAYDKHRSDHCILLWDVIRATPSSVTSDACAVAITNTSSNADRPRPLAEMGLSETAHSVAWMHTTARTLLASMNLKYIKIFDLRDLSNKAVSMTSTRYCYGVCADPHNEWQLASRGDNGICVWDTRAFERPVLTLPQSRPVTKMLWCPTRRNLLCSLQRDASLLRLHDLQNANTSHQCVSALTAVPAIDSLSSIDYENGSNGASGPSALERDVSLSTSSFALAGFSWHPTHQARVLAVTICGILIDHTVCERLTVNWGAGAGQLVWSDGARELRVLPDQFYTSLHDVSYVMKRRAQTDYGLKPDLWQVGELADDESLNTMWNFLALSKSLVEDGCIRNSPWRHPGVKWALRAEGTGYRSEMVLSLLPDLPNRRVPTYKSAERNRALQLCNWGWGLENVGATLERLEAEGKWCRAAALAAFHLRLRAALDVLTRAPPPHLHLRVVALALAGYSDERLWRDIAKSALPALSDPYLRGLFAFLTALDGDYDDVLNETEMRLDDRVAFACIFLPDAKLAEYVRSLTVTLTEQGDLTGMLLTGASTECLPLLQNWLDSTGDVQSVALVAARTFTPDLLRDLRAQHWIDSYRCLLDSWRLWWARCNLDTWAGGVISNEVPAQQVCISCGYCGKTVATAVPQQRTRAALALARHPPPTAKMKQISACPHCRKPLPRCAVCTLHTGTAAGGAEFPGWFTWCVACRHGGHAKHLLQWFQEHSECPVSSCTCRCISMDLPAQL